MRRAPRARVQIASTTTPATVPAATFRHEALQEDGAPRALPQAFAPSPGPGGDGAEHDDAEHDEALVAEDDEDDDDDDDGDDASDNGFEQLTNHRGLPVTMANTVRARTKCLAQRARVRACLLASPPSSVLMPMDSVSPSLLPAACAQGIWRALEQEGRT